MLGRLPQEQVAYWEAAVHRVEQIADLGVLPDKRALDIWQTDLAEVDKSHEVVKRVADVLEARSAHVPSWASSVFSSYGFGVPGIVGASRRFTILGDVPPSVEL